MVTRQRLVALNARFIALRALLPPLRFVALNARFTALRALLPPLRLGIGATLSIAFLAVAVLAAAANLISERGVEIMRTTDVPAAKAVVVPPQPAGIPEVELGPLPTVSPTVLLTAIGRYDLALQSRVIAPSEESAIELRKAAHALQETAEELLHDVKDRSDERLRKQIRDDIRNYKAAGAHLIETADDQRAVRLGYSTLYDGMHARARAAIDGAWKVFGRVIARQALVTLNSQVEDLGRRSARLIAYSDDEAASAEVAISENLIAATLADNERGLSSSQGKDWVALMSQELKRLSLAREKLLQVEVQQRDHRGQFAHLRSRLERRSRNIVVPRVTAPATPAIQHEPASTLQTAAISHATLAPGAHTVTTTVTPETDGRRAIVAWLSGGVLMLLVVICVVTVRSVAGPVRQLVNATAQLAQGDMNARVAAGGIKELNTLAIAFNEMAERLAQAECLKHDYQVQLEAKVLSRTEQLKYLASNDPLTGLPNRREFFVLLNQAMNSAVENNALVGVFFLDIDNFKNINDGMGHAYGDHVLQAMARRLQSAAAALGFAARFGGDEFTVVMLRAASLDEIRDAGVRLVHAFDEPLSVDGSDLRVSVSVGASAFPYHEQAAEALLGAADAAMFRAKALGRSQLTMYTPELLAAAAAKFATEQGLRRALEMGEFELVFQPELSVATFRVELVEALIRWRQPDGRLASPGEFLAVAEESGLIMDISDWVLRTAVETAARWHHGDWPQARVAINVSSRQLIDSNFVERVKTLLRAYRLPPRCIEIELTESVLQTGSITLEALQQLRAHGIAIALDDFGTGYSTLASLQQLPLTRIKLDRSLVDEIDRNTRALAIARSIIGLSQSLGLEITAEGIERPEQLSLLLGEGSMYVQGYLLSRPLAETDLLPALSSVAQRSLALLLPDSSQRRRAQETVREKVERVIDLAERANVSGRA